jgi:hypothetical protein
MKCLIAAIATFSLPMAVWGQTQLLSGARVRVTTSDTRETLVGKVAGIRESALELTDVKSSAEVTPVRSLPVGALATIEVSRGSKGRSGLFSLIGLGVGVGSALALCAGDQCRGDFGPNTSQSAILLGAFGAGLGALVGLVARHEVWEPVPKESLRVAIAPARGRGIAVALSVGF